MKADATAARLGAAKLKLALSELLHAEIERQSTTIHAVALAAGVSDQTVRDVFAGVSLPRLDLVLALEKALDRPAGWIVRSLTA